MSDTLPTATRVADPGIRALYQLENRWQAWLDVEVALARTQAELGIIPAAAADAITAKAKLAGLWREKVAVTDPSGEKAPRYIISDRPMTEEEWARERCGE